MNKLLYKVNIALLGLILILANFFISPINVMAEDSNLLHIEYKNENKPIPNVAFRVYRVANLHNVNEYIYTDQFANCTTTINNQMPHSAWVKAAEDLEDYVSQNGIAAQYSDRTDSSGEIILYGIPSGLYLIDGDSVTIDDITYTPQVFCTLVSPENTDSVSPKFTQEAVVKPGSDSPSTPSNSGGGGSGGGGGKTTVASKQDPSTPDPETPNPETPDQETPNPETPDQSTPDPANPSSSGDSDNNSIDTDGAENKTGDLDSNSEHRYEHGDLVITKTVSGQGGDMNADWHFSLTVTPSVNGTYGDVTFVDGVAEFTLKHGESVVVTNLPEGTDYTITEAEAGKDGYTSSWTGATGTISYDAVSKADFLNVRDEVSSGEARGNLQVLKTVTGIGDKNRDWHFRVALSEPLNGSYGDMDFTDGVAEFTLKHNESVTATSLPSGINYKVIEIDAGEDGYTTNSDGASGTIPANETVRVTFTNNLAPVQEHVPQTGDQSNMRLWFGLMVVSFILLLAVPIYGFMRKNK